MAPVTVGEVGEAQELHSGLKNLARYIVRACFSQQRMVYIPVEKSAEGVAKVIYTSKDGSVKKPLMLWTGPAKERRDVNTRPGWCARA